MNLPKQDSAVGRGIKTSAQGFIGAVLAILIGLITVIHNVPGCGEAVAKFAQDNIVLIAGGFGVSSGTVSVIWNLFRKDVPNY